MFKAICSANSSPKRTLSLFEIMMPNLRPKSSLENFSSSFLSTINCSFKGICLIGSSTKSKKLVLSMCFKKASPKPLPTLAPSIIPGISAITKELYSSTSTSPSFGVRVVNS